MPLDVFSDSDFREVYHAVFGQFMIVFFVVLAVLAAIGFWMKKKESAKTGEERSPDKVLENVADLADNFNRARYQDQDGN